ncbi:hypothetical protein EVAR_50793_1 [Eumeta japonica]|uniref:Uncharacterized protein n=1 Tax=Eumeta variegata TaxID=151549 RepID=A0A4C1XC49_EUMVA|nr:hypothetical protein EVAR_50793_1 [Eumeta japonica]
MARTMYLMRQCFPRSLRCSSRGFLAPLWLGGGDDGPRHQFDGVHIARGSLIGLRVIPTGRGSATLRRPVRGRPFLQLPAIPVPLSVVRSVSISIPISVPLSIRIMSQSGHRHHQHHLDGWCSTTIRFTDNFLPHTVKI